MKFRNTLKKMSALIGLLAGCNVHAAYHGAAMIPQAALPGDRENKHEVVMTSSQSEYTVTFKGNIDGVMTRMPVSFHPYLQGWQPNVSTRMENIGETDIVNPWIRVNGRGDWRTLEGLVEEATRGCTNDAEKARAIFEWQSNHRFHATTCDEQETSDPVKIANVYGYTICGNDAAIVGRMWRLLGFPVRPAHPCHHVVNEVSVNNRFQLMDSDTFAFYFRRDNRTIASEDDVLADPDLMKRTHGYSTSFPEDSGKRQISAALYHSKDNRGPAISPATHNMFFTLRPGEALEWRWNHIGKEYAGGSLPGSLIPNCGIEAFALLRNSKHQYQPPLDKAICRRGMLNSDNLALKIEDGREGNLHPAKDETPARIVWRIHSPYVMVGGSVKCRASRKAAGDIVRLSWSSDGKSWKEIARAAGTGSEELTGKLDGLISPPNLAMYAYFIQLEMQSTQGGGAGLDSILFDTDLQTSVLGLPELTTGINKILYTDKTLGERKMKMTHTWIDRTEWQPPAEISDVLFPADGADVEGTGFTFRWTAPQARTPGTAIADYQIQVYDRADMRWPMSSNFNKLSSKTPSAGKPEWTIPSIGLLNPGEPYFWRVRAKDSNGVWGGWSRPFRFSCRAPGVPQNLKCTATNSNLTISWEPDPSGTKPVSYKIYGSNEKGFTASDTPYRLRMKIVSGVPMDQYLDKRDTSVFQDDLVPSNLVARVTANRWEPASPCFAFYRIVAVDEKGMDSGASDLATLPRPFICSVPVTTAGVGQTYSCQLASTHSIGRLICTPAAYDYAFRGADQVSWALKKSPPWLTIRDGVLTGTPDAKAEADNEVIVSATIQSTTTQQVFNIRIAK